ncbi:MAG: hypothetical protein MRZ39_09590 [Oscillospiraceae bacterium]|nr:hypothetical protein [Oscillospiraceae bacterium]
MTVKEQPQKKTAAEKLRERKIEELRLKISQDEEIIAQTEHCGSELDNADIKGMTVAYRSFGIGTVTKREGSAITVSFGEESRRFVMPSAFVDGFLKTDDENFSGIIGRYKDMCKKSTAAKREISEMNRSIEILNRK